MVESNFERRRRRVREKKAALETLVEKRKLVRRAFEKVRYSPAYRDVAKILLGALANVDGLTEEAMEFAKDVLANRPSDRGSAA